MCVSGKPVEPPCCCSPARSGGSRLTHYFCPNISSFLPKRYSNLEKRGHLSAERSAGTLCSVSTRGHPAACDGGQTSGLCHVAVCPPPPRPSPAPKPPQRSWMETQEALSAGRASAQPPHPPPTHQSSGNLAASDCKYLRVAGRPWCYWQLITGSIIQKEEKKNTLRLERESGCWECAHLYTPLPHLLFLSSNTSCRQDSLLC